MNEVFSKCITPRTFPPFLHLLWIRLSPPSYVARDLATLPRGAPRATPATLRRGAALAEALAAEALAALALAVSAEALRVSEGS